MSRTASLIAALKQKVESGDLGSAVSVPQSHKVERTVDAEGHVSYEWDAETVKLVEWFREWVPRHGVTTDFCWCINTLSGRCYEHITGPDLFFAGVLADIASGPGGIKSRYGGLQSDLRRLYAWFGPGGTFDHASPYRDPRCDPRYPRPHVADGH